MENFKEYQIKELKKRYLSELDKMFVNLCEEYLAKEKNLPLPLYEHLNNLYWKYHD